MERTILDVPKMYADHHVEAVRATLLQLQGVDQVVASSGQKKVVVSYDPARVNPAAIQEALRAAGYAPGEEWELPKVPEGKDDDSAWFCSIQRATKTNTKDLEMSGDFRKY